MNERLVCDVMVRAAGDGAALKRILLCPDGLVKSTRGDFTFNAESFAAIRREFDARKKATLIDWEHQSLDGDYAAPDGRAPAAGWIEALEYVPGEGLYGHVKWNDDAAEAIRADKYRYLSPTIILKKEGRIVIGLDSAALTNKPAIHGMPRVAAKHEEQGMEWLKQLRELLRPHCPDLSDQADEATTLAACKSALEEIAEQRKTVEHVRGAMKLPNTATGEVIRLALDGRLSAQKSNSDEVMALKQQVEALTIAERQQRGKAMIDEAKRRNRLHHVPSDKQAELEAMALRDPDQAKMVIDLLPEFPQPGRMVTDPVPLNAGGEDAMIAEAMKEHGNKVADAYSALQRKLIAAEVGSGLRKEVAIERLTKHYPKIFGATN